MCSNCCSRFSFAGAGTHGKIRFEGMAIASHAASIGGVTPIPLFEYQCASKASPDFTVATAGWTPMHGGPCKQLSSAVAFFVLPSRVGPAAESLVELQMWYKDGDHYVLATHAGEADALSKGYIKVESLGYVWPAPGTANASSRYGLPSISKDDHNYVLQVCSLLCAAVTLSSPPFPTPPSLTGGGYAGLLAWADLESNASVGGLGLRGVQQP